MKYQVRRWSTLSLAIMLLATSFLLGTDRAFAKTEYEDGQYTVSFQVLKDGTNEPSATTEYIHLSAQVKVTDGKITAQVTLKNSSWWQEFKVKSSASGSFSNVKLVKEDKDADTRVVSFPIADIEQLVQAKIHIVVTGIPGFEYDNKYDIQFKFDASQLKEKQEVVKPTAEEKQPATASPNDSSSKEVEKSPSTTTTPKQPEKSSPTPKVEKNEQEKEKEKEASEVDAAAPTSSPTPTTSTETVAPSESTDETVEEMEAGVEVDTDSDADADSNMDADTEAEEIEEAAEQATNEAAPEAMQEGDEVEAAQEKQSSATWIWVVGIIVLIVAAGSLIYIRKRRV